MAGILRIDHTGHRTAAARSGRRLRLQDFATRDRYRQAVEVLANGSGLDELAVCDRVLELAARHWTDVASNFDSPSEAHVGFYLVGDGRPDFERIIGYRANGHFGRLAFIVRHGRLLYFGTIAAITLILLMALIAAALPLHRWWTTALGVLIAILPATELAVGIVNYLVTKVVPPNSLPKLDFSNGIPSDCATFVVIPTLLTSAETAISSVERLETHYLSNPDPQLRFALLTDWADAPTEHLPADDLLVQTALSGIAALNRRYDGGRATAVFSCSTGARRWNPSEAVWMGWERKRGKLSEFNRLLLGATDTSYAVTSVPAGADTAGPVRDHARFGHADAARDRRRG